MSDFFVYKLKNTTTYLLHGKSKTTTYIYIKSCGF